MISGTNQLSVDFFIGYIKKRDESESALLLRTLTHLTIFLNLKISTILRRKSQENAFLLNLRPKYAIIVRNYEG